MASGGDSYEPLVDSGDGSSAPSGPDGLSSEEASRRLEIHGPNVLEEKEENTLLMFLGYFWGPMPIMIWVAIVVEFINEEWPDFGVLLLLQIVNGCVGFVEEKNAGDAISALKDSLAAKANVKRDGRFRIMEAKFLVPGDLINLKLGDIVPADARLHDGQPMEIDQAALTGESLPVTVYPGESVKMGATVKRGELEATIVFTGKNTFFGKAAAMVASVESRGRFQLILFRITMFLLGLAVCVVIVILSVLLAKGESALSAIAIAVVLLVASIPIAMQVVSTSTMAVGSRRLAEKKVIVAKLSAIEEMAGMDMLCSDKTGTLTLNQLQLFDPIVIADITAEELTFQAALAAKKISEGQDAIDYCITNAVPDKQRLMSYEELDFEPFDPVSKRTVATLRSPDGEVFKTCKGAPQVVLRMSDNCAEVEERVSIAVQDLADRGYRALGVAKTNDAGEWIFQGVLSLFDPPRPDTASTIKSALEMGIEVKMITGDQTAIAKETSRTLGMGTNILGTEVLDSNNRNLPEIVRDADGFAEVFPEHKFQIVQLLMEQGFTCGMTGDGVNDAPALKKAHIGIAVEGSTDAARAAADIVLTEEGLSVIIDAVLRARKIFARVRNYCIYRISATLQLVFFFFVIVIAIDPALYFTPDERKVTDDGTLFTKGKSTTYEKVFTLPVIALVLITILNDGTIITIARDKVIPASRPQGWNLPEIYTVSAALGGTLVVEGIFMMLMVMNAGNMRDGAQRECSIAGSDAAPCDDWLSDIFGHGSTGTIHYDESKTVIYMTLSLSAFLTVFAARTRELFISRRPGYTLACASAFALTLTTIIAATIKSISSSLDMGNLQGKTIAFVWAYVVFWFLIQDTLVKQAIYWVYDTLHERSAEAERLNLAKAHKVTSTTIEGERHDTRYFNGGSKHAPSVLQGLGSGSHAGSFSGSVAGAGAGRVEHLEAKVAQLEQALADVRSLLAAQQN